MPGQDQRVRPQPICSARRVRQPPSVSSPSRSCKKTRKDSSGYKGGFEERNATKEKQMKPWTGPEERGGFKGERWQHGKIMGGKAQVPYLIKNSCCKQ